MENNNNNNKIESVVKPEILKMMLALMLEMIFKLYNNKCNVYLVGRELNADALDWHSIVKNFFFEIFLSTHSKF